MTSTMSEEDRLFKAAPFSPAAVIWLPAGFFVILFPVALGYYAVGILTGVALWELAPFAAFVLGIVIALSALDQWIRSRQLYLLSESEIEMPRGKPTFVPYRDIRSIVIAPGPFAALGWLRLETDAATHRLHPAAREEMASELSRRTGIEIERQAFTSLLAEHVRAYSLLILLLLLFNFVWLLASMLWFVPCFLLAVADSIFVGRKPAKSKARWIHRLGRRFVVPAMVLIAFVGKWGLSLGNPVAAADLSLIGPALESNREVEICPGATFQAPGGATLGRSSRDECDWLAVRPEGRKLRGALLLFGSMEVGRSGDRENSAENVRSLSSLAQSCMKLGVSRLLTIRMGNISPHPPITIGNAEWFAFEHGWSTRSNRRILTCWQLVGERIVTVTFLRGGPEEESVGILLDSMILDDHLQIPDDKASGAETD